MPSDKRGRLYLSIAVIRKVMAAATSSLVKLERQQSVQVGMRFVLILAPTS